MRQLSPSDAAMLYLLRQPNHIVAVMLYDPESGTEAPTYDEVLEHVAARIPRAPRLRERLISVPLGLDLPYWISDDRFDLEFHVRHMALPSPGDWRQFLTLTARLHAQPIDLSRPPWELYVIEGLRGFPGMSEQAFAVVVKVHHAAVDGVAGLEVINVIHGPPADPASSGDLAEPEPSVIELLARAAFNTVGTPRRFVRSLNRTAPLQRARHQLGEVIQRGITLPAPRPPTRFGGRVSAHRVLGSTLVRLDELKVIRKAVASSTVNDVALAIVGGALRAYLQKIGELPEASLTAIVPISIRRPGDDTGGGNRISSMVVPLGTNIPEPVARLAAVTEFTTKTKQRRQAVDAHSLLELSEGLPGALLGVGLRAAARGMSRAPQLANTTVSNVPNSPTPLQFCDAKAVHFFGGGPVMDGMGLLNAVGSYNGEFHFSFTACRDMLPDPEFYEDRLRESFAEMQAGAG